MPENHYPARNQIRMGLSHNVIDIQIEATSPEKATEFYAAIESLVIEIARVDMELDWRNDEGDKEHE